MKKTTVTLLLATLLSAGTPVMADELAMMAAATDNAAAARPLVTNPVLAHPPVILTMKQAAEAGLKPHAPPAPNQAQANASTQLTTAENPHRVRDWLLGTLLYIVVAVGGGFFLIRWHHKRGPDE